MAIFPDTFWRESLKYDSTLMLTWNRYVLSAVCCDCCVDVGWISVICHTHTHT